MKRPIIVSTLALSQGILGLQTETEELTEKIQRNAAFTSFAVVTHRQDITGSVFLLLLITYANSLDYIIT